MKNIFEERTPHSIFSWEGLGDIKEGRENLGEEMPVIVYRLMEFTMLDILSQEYGNERANELFIMAGFKAGEELARNVLDLTQNFDGFVAQLQQTLKVLKVGILRVEDYDSKTGEMTLTVAEDLDCSGLPNTNEVVCNYDEGFIAGILFAYTGAEYEVKEVDCWAKGDRVCRFQGTVKATRK